MPSNSPSGSRYSRLPGSLHSEKSTATSNSFSGDTAKPTSTATHSERPRNHHLKLHLFFNAIAFILVEVGFLILAYYCAFGVQAVPFLNIPATNQIKVRIFSRDHETSLLNLAKHGIIAISTAWHILAAYFINNFIGIVCSGEFMAQYRWYGPHPDGRVNEPGKVDKVSKVTSGLFDRTQHFLTRSATREYRLVFGIVLVVLALGPLGSSTLVAETTYKYKEVTGGVASVMNSTKSVVQGTGAEHHAEFIIQMEYFQGTPLGFVVEPNNTLIPWAHSGRSGDVDTLGQFPFIYHSDVARYNYTCSWAVNGSYTPGEGGTTVEGPDGNALRGGRFHADQITYKQFNTSGFIGVDVPSIVQIDPASADGTLVPNTTTAFAFVTDGTPLWADYGLGTLDLSNVPTFPMFNSTVGAILVCDPQVIISPAKVTLNGNTLTANPSSRTSHIGNFDQNAVTRVFSAPLRAMMGGTIVPLNVSAPNMINWFSLDLFLMNLTESTIPIDPDPHEPLPLDVINSKMNRFTQSAAKAYLSGYWDLSTDDVTDSTFRHQRHTDDTYRWYRGE